MPKKSRVLSGIDRGADVEAAAPFAAVTFANSWANKTGGYAAAGYARSEDGVVRLRGTVDTGTKAATTVLFTLPAGFRPATKLVFSVTDDAAGTQTAKQLVVASDGTVAVGAAALAASSFVSLDGISFVAA